MTQTEWNIREALDTDLPFIYSSWLKSLRYGSETFRGVRNHIFFPHYNHVIDYILSSPEIKILVACHREHPETVFGYIVYEPKIIHYIYVKKDFCRFGIGRFLWGMAGMIPDYSHRTLDLVSILKRHPEQTSIWNPFILYHQLKGDEDGRET